MGNIFHRQRTDHLWVLRRPKENMQKSKMALFNALETSGYSVTPFSISLFVVNSIWKRYSCLNFTFTDNE